MVSVKMCSLPDRYIDAAHKLIDTLISKGYNIEYAFYYLRYGDDREWTDGDWWLGIATNDLDHYQGGTRVVNDIIDGLDIDVLNDNDFNYDIRDVNVERDNYYNCIGERVDIKKPEA